MVRTVQKPEKTRHLTQTSRQNSGCYNFSALLTLLAGFENDRITWCGLRVEANSSSGRFSAWLHRTCRGPQLYQKGRQSPTGCFENLDGTCLRYPREVHPKLAIVITDEILRSLAIGGGFPKLLCGPSVGGRSCDVDIDHFARVQFDNEKGEKRTEEKVGDREKIAGPDLLSMIAQEDPPVLTPWSSRTHLPHVLLDRSFADMQS